MDRWITTTEQAAAGPTLAAFHLDRLASLVARRHTAIDERQRVALARGTFSVFLECRDLGLHDEAEAIVARRRGAPTIRSRRS